MAASPCWRWPRRPTRSRSTSAGGAADRPGAVRPGRLPLPAPLGGLPAAARRAAGPDRPGRLRRRRAPAPVRGHRPARDGHEAANERAAGPAPAPAPRPRRRPGGLRRPRRRGVREGRAGLAGRGRAAVDWPAGDPAAAARQAAAVLAAIVDDAVGVPAPARSPSAPCRSPPAPGPPWSCPRWRWPGRGRHAVGYRDRHRPGRHRRPPRPGRRARPGPSPCATRSRLAAGGVVRPSSGPPLSWPAALAKVVLARQVDVTADRPLDRRAVLERLRAAYPGCHIVGAPGSCAPAPSCWCRSAATWSARTRWRAPPRGGDPAADQRRALSLLGSTKDRQEHQITIDMVHDTLLGWCSYVDYEAEPSVVAVANVQHLATLVEGRLSCPTPSVLELVAALHPTPAVAGWPGRTPWPGSPATRASTGAATPDGRVGRRRRQRHVGRVGPLGRDRRPPARVFAGNGSWPTATRRSSWPRPGPSSRPTVRDRASPAPQRGRHRGGHGPSSRRWCGHVGGPLGAHHQHPHAPAATAARTAPPTSSPGSRRRASTP